MPYVSLFLPLRPAPCALSPNRGLTIVALYLIASQKNVLLGALKRLLNNTRDGENV
jgi:hypothetical protein